MVLKPSSVVSVIFGATTVEVLSLMNTPTTSEPGVDFFVWAIKVVGTVAMGLIAWYTRRVLLKMDKVMDFFDKAPKDFWGRFEALEDAVEDLQTR